MISEGRAISATVVFQPYIFLLGTAMRHGLGDQVRDLVGIERLVNVVVGAVLQGCDRRFHRCVAGHNDDQHVGVNFVKPPLQLDPIGPAHLDVDQGEVEYLFGNPRQALHSRSRPWPLRSLLRQTISPANPYAEFIVNNE